MKSPFLIGLSAIALVVLVLVQSLFVRDTYQTKQKQLETRYGVLAREALKDFNERDFTFDFDSVLFLLDKKALDYLYADPDTLDISYAATFYSILSGYTQPEEYIRESVLMAGEDPSFTYHLRIQEVFLTDLGYDRRVYPDSTLLPVIPVDAFLAGSYVQERNFFRASYQILISFRNPVSMVIREMRLILSLTLASLILVFLVFFLTLRNMLQQLRLSNLKTDFINNMTHELKTPLSTISVASSTLGDGRVMRQKGRVEELSALIKKQNRHLSELIDRILDINIWEKDQVRLRQKEVSPGPWLHSLADAFTLEREKEELELSVLVKDPPEKVLMDEVHMSTAVNNLLSNALKYGHPPVKMQLELSGSEHWLVLSVRDNGPGIRKEDQKHVFEIVQRIAQIKFRRV
jgi:signal transduction histidine kinase